MSNYWDSFGLKKACKAFLHKLAVLKQMALNGTLVCFAFLKLFSKYERVSGRTHWVCSREKP